LLLAQLKSKKLALSQGVNPEGGGLKRRGGLRPHRILRARRMRCSTIAVASAKPAQGTAALLVLGFVSAQWQGVSNLRLRRNLAQNQAFSQPHATSFRATR
jgi:hypothetical protein